MCGPAPETERAFLFARGGLRAILRRAVQSAAMIPWLRSGDPFPPVERALEEPNGLLAAGADLSVARLISAYERGIFPWYGDGQPVLWWSPDPRMVLFPDQLRIPRSLRKRLARRDYEVFDPLVLNDRDESGIGFLFAKKVGADRYASHAAMAVEVAKELVAAKVA